MSSFFFILILLFKISMAQLDNDIPPPLFCAACKATVEQIEKALKKTPKRTEGDVMTVFESVCTMANFKTYDFIPPKMVHGCEKVLEHEEKLEKLFIKKLPVKEIEQKMCFGEITKACVGVDASNPQNKDPNVYIDGEKTETKKVEVPPPKQKKATAKKIKTEI